MRTGAGVGAGGDAGGVGTQFGAQTKHKQISRLSYLVLVGRVAIYSEKNRSPLSGGNFSAVGKGMETIPAFEAKLLTYQSSE